MSLGNSPASYGLISKVFHWLTALLILTVIPLGIVANGLTEEFRQATANSSAGLSRAVLLFSMHKTIGLTLFLVALARIAWTLSQTRPRPLHPDRRLETLAAETVHWLLYGSLLVVPLTGWFHHAATTGFAPIWWPFGQDLPFIPKNPDLAAVFAGLHKVLERVLVAAVALHIAGALKHHLVDRDQTLVRMWFGQRDLPVPPAHRRSLRPFAAATAIWALALTAGIASGMIATHRGAPNPAAPLAQVRSDWRIEGGNLSIAILQLGTPVTGRFADWTAAITYADPGPAGHAGHVEVTVSIASLELGSVSDQALGPDFLDLASHPTARYSADIRKTETGHEAVGTLSLRGISAPLVLPFGLEVQGDVATMAGTAILNRLDFGIGASVPGNNTLGATVEISVYLTARRVSP